MPAQTNDTPGQEAAAIAGQAAAWAKVERLQTGTDTGPGSGQDALHQAVQEYKAAKTHLLRLRGRNS